MSQKAPDFSASPLDCISPALWAEAFGEDEAEVRRIIDLLSPDAVAISATENGEQAFQGVLIPLLLGGSLGYYLYALSTAHTYRGRGYLRRALSFIRDYAGCTGASFLALIPADAGLDAAYRRMGFRERVALSASPDGKSGFLFLPPNREEIPFDGDEERLYLMTARTLPLSAFRAYLDSLSDEACIFYTKNGFRIRERNGSALCLLADAATASNAPLTGEAYALVDLLVPTHLPPLADPLPR